MKGPAPSRDDFQAEDDHRTITHAAEIQNDRRRMAGVRRQHTKQTKALTSVGQQIGMPRKMSGSMPMTGARRMTGGRR